MENMTIKCKFALRLKDFCKTGFMSSCDFCTSSFPLGCLGLNSRVAVYSGRKVDR